MVEPRHDLLTPYIDSQIINAESQLRLYTHLDDVSRPNRNAFSILIGKVDKFRQGEEKGRWVLMPGLRGVGKTTILAQTYQYLLSLGIPRTRVLYATMDSVGLNLGMGLNDLINAFERKTMTHFDQLRAGEEVYLLLDEIQYDPNWAMALKVLYDRSRRVFILATGSSMIALTSTADTTRRATLLPVEPLTFTEYLRLGCGHNAPPSMSARVSEALVASTTPQASYERLVRLNDEVVESLSHVSGETANYLRIGTLPSALGLSPQEAFSMINATSDKVIDQDLVNVRSFDRSTLIKAHMLLTALAVADRISHESLCTNLGMNNRTLIDLLGSLEAAGIIYRIKPYGSESTRLRKTPKYKFVAPAMRVALLSKIGSWGGGHDDMGKVFEDIATLYLREWVRQGSIQGFDYLVEDGNADFVIQRMDGRSLVMEISWGRKGPEQVERTMKKIGADHGILVADTSIGLTSDKRILRLPREWFLLSM